MKLSAKVLDSSAHVTSFIEWLDRFDDQRVVTAGDLEQFRSEAGPTRYPEMVLWLARRNKLRPKGLADASYKAWLTTENPKNALCGSEWAELFRISYLPSHELFEVPEAANSATSLS
jgi:hypothetical protein